MSSSPEDTHPLDKGKPPEQEQTQSTAPLPAGRPAGPEAFLVRIHPPGPALGLRYPLGPEPAILGRLTACTIHDPDPSVSRMHARIERGPGGRFRVTDLGSRNGTFVNHARVDSADLGDGDYLRVGNAIYRFLAGGNIEAGYHEELHRLAVTDPLTGLPNRRALTEFLEREVARARRYGRPLAAALMDVDQFKAINDGMGHLAGDATLRALAAALAPLVREGEVLARHGGDEFALALPESTAEQGRACGERLRRAVESHPFEHDGRRYAVTVSVGVGSVAPGEPVTVANLLARADGKLYEAKRAGRNRVCA
jgi:diguanylate cyclase (GGDEF)-like protein